MNENSKIKILNPRSNKCLIAFTSNANGTEKKFEFENIFNNKKISRNFYKIIFVRDVNRTFYTNGISEKINSVDKLLDFLKFETKGKEIDTIGVSSGGYMAFLLSSYLDNVIRCISLGGMINITTWKGSFQTLNIADSDFVKNSSKEQKKYFDLSKQIMKSKSNIYAFYSGVAKSDVDLMIEVKNNGLDNINIIKFNTKKHGEYCYPFDYKYLLTKSDKKLKKIFTKYKNIVISPLKFSLALQGPFLFAYNYLYKSLRGLLRRFRRKSR